MRIRRSSDSTRSDSRVDQSSPRSGRGNLTYGFRERSARWHARSAPFLRAVALGATLAAIVGLWYQLVGYRVVNPLLRDRFGGSRPPSNELSTLHVDLSPESMRVLSTQRDRARHLGIWQPTDRDWVEAQITVRDEAIPVRLRLGGDQADHWVEGKPTLQVLVDGDPIAGMRAFLMQSPALCGYLEGWFYTESLRRAGILAPRFDYLNVVVNGDHWGVYALKESLSDEFFASQARLPGTVIELDDRLSGREPDRDAPSLLDPTIALLTMPSMISADGFGAVAVSGDPVLERNYATVLGLLRGLLTQELAPSQVFDAELGGRYLAHADLWGARQELAWGEGRYYLSPATGRLEPIGHGAPQLESDPTAVGQGDDLDILTAYAQEVMRISQPEYLDEMKSVSLPTYNRYRAALSQEFYPPYLSPPWDALSRRGAALLAAFHPPQAVDAYRQLGHDEQGSDGDPAAIELHVGNLLAHPVALRELRYGDRAVEIEAGWIAEADRALLYGKVLPALVLRPARGAVPEYITLTVPVTAVAELAPGPTDALQVVASLVGVDEPVVNRVSVDEAPVWSPPSLPDTPSLEQVLGQHPFLTVSDRPGYLELEEGKWQVEGDLILPDGMGLFATKPVTLAFGPGALLYATGPLLLFGPDSGGIRLVAQDADWGGLVVAGTDSTGPSVLRNVDIRGTAGVRRDGWFTTGGVTFYEAPVVMDRCRVLGSTAQSAVHVVRSDFTILRSEFGYASLDALDGDSASGRIEECAFHDILGNAIDLRRSRVAISTLSLTRITDRGLLAGSSSQVTADVVRAEDVGMAIVSRDLSDVEVRNVRIAQAWIAGIGAYREKVSGGKATVRASGVRVEDGSVAALSQKGSSVTVNGTPQSPREMSEGAFVRRLETPGPIRVLNDRFGPEIRLIGYQLGEDELQRGGALELVLYWQARAKLGIQYTIFVHVLDASGQIVAQWDAQPRGNTYPTTEWPVGQVIDDTHTVPLPPDIPAGRVHIALGMYEWDTGTRLPVFGPDGQALAGAVATLDRDIWVR